MFAALSATNEAIMRAKSRSELFELVCEAAANGGKFTSTSIGLARPGHDFLEIVAAGGTDGGKIEDRQALRQGGLPGGTRHQRDRVPQRRALHQQRLSGRSARRPVSRFDPRRRRQRGRGVSAVQSRQAGRHSPVLRRAKKAPSRRGRWICCSGSPTISRLPSTISIARTRRPGRTSGSNIWRRMTA